MVPLRLVTRFSPVPAQRRRILRWEQAGEPIAVFARLLAGGGATWLYRVGDRYRFAIPEASRRLGLAPSAGEQAVLFACGEVFELWRGQDWTRELAAAVGKARHLHMALLDVEEDETER